jgi:hypothetical protein
MVSSELQLICARWFNMENNSSAIFGFILFVAILAVGFMELLYKKFFAPRYKVKAKVLDKGFSTVAIPVAGSRLGSVSHRNYYWGEFQVEEKDENCL